MQDSCDKYTEFDYYLNAFIGAARSVNWLMKAEYGSVPGWLQWYEAQAPERDEQQLLAAFTKLRNRSQKQEPLETKAVVVMHFPPESVTPDFKALLERGVGKRFEVTVYAVPEDGDTSKIPSTAVLGTVAEVGRRLDELGEQDVLDACGKYVAALARLVDDCEAEFAA